MCQCGWHHTTPGWPRPWRPGYSSAEWHFILKRLRLIAVKLLTKTQIYERTWPWYSRPLSVCTSRVSSNAGSSDSESVICRLLHQVASIVLWLSRRILGIQKRIVKDRGMRVGVTWRGHPPTGEWCPNSPQQIAPKHRTLARPSRPRVNYVVRLTASGEDVPACDRCDRYRKW